MKRVVFCPYLSAMWASMAPLYEEHMAVFDNVIVMPLPYATKDIDGNTIEYQVDYSFPVECMPPNYEWLKEMHPDIIYFHNPYDECNAVTQIHHEFFSKQLAQCTNELVYVPYYTYAVQHGKDTEYIIKTRGVRIANKIIVWSPEQKQRYVDILSSIGFRDLGERIIVKQRPAPRTDYVMPEEWARIANGRKLVMLGTSLGAVIHGKEAELAKICRAIQKNQRNDICLLWRPHPLYDAALIAMYPFLRGMYHDIVHHYIEYQQGILDTSWDVERAVALCEEYIGDPSSVAGMFKEQGKPVKYI